MSWPPRLPAAADAPDAPHCDPRAGVDVTPHLARLPRTHQQKIKEIGRGGCVSPDGPDRGRPMGGSSTPCRMAALERLIAGRIRHARNSRPRARAAGATPVAPVVAPT